MYRFYFPCAAFLLSIIPGYPTVGQSPDAVWSAGILFLTSWLRRD
jgi:hypothetical protein